MRVPERSPGTHPTSAVTCSAWARCSTTCSPESPPTPGSRGGAGSEGHARRAQPGTRPFGGATLSDDGGVRCGACSVVERGSLSHSPNRRTACRRAFVFGAELSPYREWRPDLWLLRGTQRPSAGASARARRRNRVHCGRRARLGPLRLGSRFPLTRGSVAVRVPSACGEIPTRLRAPHAHQPGEPRLGSGGSPNRCLVDVQSVDSTIQVDLRYATANNFTGCTASRLRGAARAAPPGGGYRTRPSSGPAPPRRPGPQDLRCVPAGEGYPRDGRLGRADGAPGAARERVYRPAEPA